MADCQPGGTHADTAGGRWKPSGENLQVKVLAIRDEEGNEMESCPHPQQKIFVRFDMELEQYDLIRQA